MEMTAAHNKLLAKIVPMCENAIGQSFTIRTDKTVTVSGKIVKAEFGRFRYTGKSVGVVFKVTMECGANKTLREFFVSKIPQ